MTTSVPTPRRLLRIHAAAAVWTLLLLALLLLPGGTPGGDFGMLRGLDKVGHFGLFLVETLLLRRSFLYSLPRRPLVSAVAVGIVLALVTEIGQVWVPRRSYEGADLLADVAGVGLGASILWFWRAGERDTS